MFTNILGFDVFNDTKKAFMKYIEKYEKVNIISGNPEILLNGYKNQELSHFFKDEKSVIIPDGIGTVLASKLLKGKIKEKIAGIDIVKELLYKCEKEEKSVYLLGSKEEVICKCIENLKKQYPKLKIAGYHNGYFDINNCSDLTEEIIHSDAYAVFIAMGSPRQEIFIKKIIDKSKAKIFMGVGGVFDVFSGNVKRAPKWMISLGLEWLYRTIKDPVRIKRLGSIPVFLIKCITDKKN